MPPRIRMVAIDIDGTLLPSTGTEISPRNRRALCEAQAAGIHVVIATGRRHRFAIEVASSIGLPPDNVLISSNGSIVRRFDGALMRRSLLAVETARALCGALRPFGQGSVFTFDRAGVPALVVESVAALDRRVAPWVAANRDDILEISPLEQAFDGAESPIQGMLCGSIPQVRAAERSLAALAAEGQLALHRTEYPERSLGILDLLPPGCSKGNALSAHARDLGIEPHEVMAIGDNFNDQDMLEYAGHAVVMGNSGPEMRAMARSQGWHICATNDADGVAQVLEPLSSAAAAQADSSAATADAAARKW